MPDVNITYGPQREPILKEYFNNTANVLLAEYKRSRGQNSSTDLGTNREHFCRNFLSKVLPLKLKVTKGEIIDTKDNSTGQLDVIIIRDDAPAITYGEAETYLVEGVFSVIEVKSNLTTDELERAANTLSRVKALEPICGAIISSGPVLARPLRIVFAYEGATWETLKDEINTRGWSDLFDLIVILNRGILINKGLLLKWNNAESFAVAYGGAAALGFLYYHLIQYSSTFVGRSLNLGGYFEPINRWNND